MLSFDAAVAALDYEDKAIVVSFVLPMDDATGDRLFAEAHRVLCAPKGAEVTVSLAREGLFFAGEPAREYGQFEAIAILEKREGYTHRMWKGA